MTPATACTTIDRTGERRTIWFRYLFGALAAALCLLVLGAPGLAAEPPAIRILINGQVLASDAPPEIVNDRTMVPVRAIAEALGAQVEWLPATSQVTIQRPEGQIALQIGSTTIQNNFFPVNIEVAPYIRHGRTMVPLRFVAEALAADVDWDEKTLTVSITDRPPPPPALPPVPPPTIPPVASRLTELIHQVGTHGEVVEIRGAPLGTPSVFTLAAPARIVLDFAGGLPKPPVGQMVGPVPGTALVRAARAGEPEPGTARVVVELGRSAFWQVSAADGAVKVELSERPASLDGLHVVVDAGHGGVDSGARGPAGYREKAANLAVALRLGQHLTDWQAQVTQIRSDDRTVDLYDRPARANALGADVYVSIHHNSARDPNITGTETYYHRSSPESRPLAQMVQRELLRTLGSIDRGVQTADFVVIRQANMPAILVEAEFIQNPVMEQLIRTPVYQDQVAAAIARGVAGFWLGDGYLYIGG